MQEQGHSDPGNSTRWFARCSNKLALSTEAASQTEQMVKWMQEHDADKNGTLDRQELTSLLRALAKEVMAENFQGVAMDALTGKDTATATEMSAQALEEFVELKQADDAHHPYKTHHSQQPGSGVFRRFEFTESVP